MFGSILAVCVKGTFDVGGLGVVLQRNEDGGRLNAPEYVYGWLIFLIFFYISNRQVDLGPHSAIVHVVRDFGWHFA